MCTLLLLFLCFLPVDDSPGESSPFINSDNDREHYRYYEGKNMALFEVGQMIFLQIYNVLINIWHVTHYIIHVLI